LGAISAKSVGIKNTVIGGKSMEEKGERSIEIRSNGGGVIGRITEKTQKGNLKRTAIKAPTRKHLLREVRKNYSVPTNIAFARRGQTFF